MTGKLVVGTHGTGVYSTTISDITDIFPSSSDIANIEQNQFNVYPNPANSLVNLIWKKAITNYLSLIHLAKR